MTTSVLISDETDWRDIPGYPGYEVSNYGQVRGRDRMVTRGNGAYSIAGRVLKPGTRRYGHQYVSLSVDGVSATLSVHKLVMLAFVGPRPDGLEVCHNDGNPANNALSNLRFDTRSRNVLDSVRHGTHPQARRTHCRRGQHPLTPCNTYVDPKGRRSCRICTRELARHRKAA
jgi:hypothetical protein